MTTRVLHPKELQTARLPLDVGRRSETQKVTNLRVLVLALAAFAIGTGVFVVTGLLGAVAEDFSVPVGVAGHLVTIYAVAYAALSPLLVAATGRVARKRLLVAVLALFALANLAAAVAPSFALLLACRVVAACFAAICVPVATAVAAGLVAPEHRGRALSVVLGGASVSWVVGVPAGVVVADLFGWRASFVLVAVLAAVAAAGVGTLLPGVKNPLLPGGLASRMAVVGRPAVLATLAVTVLGMAAAFTTLTYVRPLLEDLMGFGSRGIASMLLLFGLASIVGSVLGGYGADRRGYGQNVVTVLMVLAFSLLLFSLLPAVGAGPTSAAVGAGVALAGWAVAGFALVPLQQHRLIRLAPDQQNGVLALNASAIYAGQGFGAVLGSLVLGYASPAALGGAGAACAAAALIASILSARLSAEAS